MRDMTYKEFLLQTTMLKSPVGATFMGFQAVWEKMKNGA